ALEALPVEGALCRGRCPEAEAARGREAGDPCPCLQHAPPRNPALAAILPRKAVRSKPQRSFLSNIRLSPLYKTVINSRPGQSAGRYSMQNDVKLKGVFAAGLTPLRPDLSIDQPALAAHCRWLLERGCHGVALFGSTGEGTSFSVGE